MPQLTPFEKYGKTPRYFRDVHITEKLDGTNAVITFMSGLDLVRTTPLDSDTIKKGMPVPGYDAYLFAGSRNRLITPGKGTDNYGFAAWSYENAAALYEALGVGRHYGEWYGLGIARGYDLPEKRWALFNPHKYAGTTLPARVETVPLLLQQNMATVSVPLVLRDLAERGSVASPGFMSPEGIIIRHSASKAIYKALIGDDGGNLHVKDPSPEELEVTP